MYKKYFKRILDLIISFLVLPLFIFIYFIVALLIYIEDQGKIFYNSHRLGKNGEVFVMYKFRSMQENAPDIRKDDGSTFNSKEDPRLTKVGKFIRKTSLDETPQILNVIKGEMSIIGPRPDLPGQKKLYKDNEERKLEVKPGITGYNQAYFRNNIPWKKRIEKDIYYIDHLTFIFDIKIIFKTIISILKTENIYNS